MMFPNPYVGHVGQQGSKSQGLSKGYVLAKCIKIWKIPFQITLITWAICINCTNFKLCSFTYSLARNDGGVVVEKLLTRPEGGAINVGRTEKNRLDLFLWITEIQAS